MKNLKLAILLAMGFGSAVNCADSERIALGKKIISGTINFVLDTTSQDTISSESIKGALDKTFCAEVSLEELDQITTDMHNLKNNPDLLSCIQHMHEWNLARNYDVSKSSGDEFSQKHPKCKDLINIVHVESINILERLFEQKYSAEQN